MRSLVDSLASKKHANFDLKSQSCHGSPHAYSSCMSCKAWREPLVFPFFQHSWWFLWTPCPQGQWNRFLVIFMHYRALVFQLPISASPSALHFLPISSRVLAINDLAWMSLAVLSVSFPDRTNIRLEVSYLEWTEWNLSTNQTNLLIHRYSNSHRCCFLAKHPSSHV